MNCTILSPWIASAAVELLLACVAAPCIGQTVEEFKKASQVDRGCNAIPYADLKDACERKGRDKDRWCQNEGPRACVDQQSGRQGLADMREQRRRVAGDIESTERARSSAKDDKEKRDIADKLEQKKAELGRLSDVIEKREDALLKEKEVMRKRVYVNEQCISFRKEVQQIFKDTKSKANSENRSDIVDSARKIASNIERQEGIHEDEVQEVRKVKGDCERYL